MADIGDPIEKPEIEILPTKVPVPEREPVTAPVGPDERPDE